jgi:hypothetical protein
MSISPTPGIAGSGAPFILFVIRCLEESFMNHTQPSRSRFFILAIAAAAAFVMQGLVTSGTQAREHEATATGLQGEVGSVEVARKP